MCTRVNASFMRCCRLFENFDVPRDDPKRTRIEVSVSPGASVDVMTGMPYAPYDSLSEDVTSLHLSSEVSGSLLKMVKSHTSPPEVGRVKPTLTQASSFRTRGKMGSRPVPSKEVSPAATPTPPPTPPVQKQVFFDREQHLLAVLPCVPVSAPSLTLTELEASLLAAIQSVEPDGSPAAVPRL